MKYYKVEVDPKLLTSTEWASFVPPADTKYPRVYMIEGGAAKVFMSPSYNSWLAAGTLPAPLEDTPEKIEAAPNPQFSESFILKLVAISKDSSLAKDLTK